MKWVKASEYAINSGNWYICKSLLSGVEKFTLWKGEKRIGDFDTAEKAKEATKNER